MTTNPNELSGWELGGIMLVCFILAYIVAGILEKYEYWCYYHKASRQISFWKYLFTRNTE